MITSNLNNIYILFNTKSTTYSATSTVDTILSRKRVVSRTEWVNILKLCK